MCYQPDRVLAGKYSQDPIIITYIVWKSKRKNLINTNADWLKPKEKTYFHRISLDCIAKLVGCLEKLDKDKIWFGVG